MMPFLYFPEDKSEYLPAILILTLFIILAVGALYGFYKYSKKEERRFNEKYQEEIRYAEENDDRY
ncbi:hypothetical protein [Virgibacillus sediminis]|uniref:Uncharacterized protein n=1 Tax=Virgibacillus sediminis TaxID=202260 RepID=A0ABV7A260_9BACI